jgi:hypothetical protein
LPAEQVLLIAQAQNLGTDYELRLALGFAFGSARILGAPFETACPTNVRRFTVDVPQVRRTAQILGRGAAGFSRSSPACE